MAREEKKKNAKNLNCEKNVAHNEQDLSGKGLKPRKKIVWDKTVQVLQRSLKYLVLGFLLLMSFYPLFMMVAISFKTNRQLAANPWFFDPPNEWCWKNWENGFRLIFSSILNTVFVSVVGTILSLAIILAASYALARYRFPGRGLIYALIVATMFMPGTTASVMNLFHLIQQMNLMNQLGTVILCTSVSAQAGAVIILCHFIEEMPRDAFEAAEIDGAGHWDQIRHIFLPMSGPVISTVILMQFLHFWNELILPWIIIRDPALLTLPVALAHLDGEYVKQWGEIMAAYLMASLPLVIGFLFFMRIFMRGLLSGTIKG